MARAWGSKYKILSSAVLNMSGHPEMFDSGGLHNSFEGKWKSGREPIMHY